MILDNRLTKMNMYQFTSQDGNQQPRDLTTKNQALVEQLQLVEKKKKKKCHGNRREQQRRRRLRKREQKQQQQQVEPMDQDDRSQDEQIQVSDLLLFLKSILFVILLQFRHHLSVVMIISIKKISVNIQIRIKMALTLADQQVNYRLPKKLNRKRRRKSKH